MKRPGSEERFKHISLSEVSFYHLFQSPLKNRIYMYYIVWYHTTYYIITSNYYIMLIYCSTPVQFSSVTWLCPTLWPHESQHARPPCPLPTPGVYSNSCPSSRWCHPAISSSVVPFSSCPQSLPASGSFPMSQLFAWGCHSIGVSASASVLPMNTQDWSPSGWTGWISLQSKELSYQKTINSDINRSKMGILGKQVDRERKTKTTQSQMNER